MCLDDATPFIHQAANEVARSFPMVEVSDLRQEGFLWAVSNPDALERYLTDENTRRGSAMLYSSLRNRLRLYAREEKAQQLGYSPADERFYSTGEIRELLAAVWDEGAWSAPTPTESSIGRSKSPANERGNWLASLSDVTSALRYLNERDRWLLEQRFRYDEPQTVLAERLGIAESSVSEAIDRAIRKIHARLGGDRPRDRPDEVGSRRKMSNAAAQAITNTSYEG